MAKIQTISVIHIYLIEIDEKFINHPKIHRVGAPIIELSSTFIRESIKKGKNIVPMLPHKVWEYLDHNNFYKK